MEKLKIGEKGRHIEIPDGYFVTSQNHIVDGNCLVANIYTAKWEEIPADEIGLRAYIVGDHVISKNRP